jgi:hypothetical protein
MRCSRCNINMNMNMKRSPDDTLTGRGRKQIKRSRPRGSTAVPGLVLALVLCDLSSSFLHPLARRRSQSIIRDNTFSGIDLQPIQPQPQQASNHNYVNVARLGMGSKDSDSDDNDNYPKFEGTDASNAKAKAPQNNRKGRAGVASASSHDNHNNNRQSSRSSSSLLPQRKGVGTGGRNSTSILSQSQEGGKNVKDPQSSRKKKSSSLLPPRNRDKASSSASSSSNPKNLLGKEDFLFPWSSDSLGPQPKKGNKGSSNNRNSQDTKRSSNGNGNRNGSGGTTGTTGRGDATPTLFPLSSPASNPSPLPLSEEISNGLSSSASSSILDGVLPVSELFYRSTQSLDSTEDDIILPRGNNSNKEGARDSSDNVPPIPHLPTTSARTGDNDMDSMYGDDEELPFSAEQSNRLTTRGVNKINVRRNEVASSRYDSKSINHDDQDDDTDVFENDHDSDDGPSSDGAKTASRQSKRKRRSKNASSSSASSPSTSSSLPKQSRGKGTQKTPLRTRGFGGRKMVRRGMEMLVGGEPINADPPLRSIEVKYDAEETVW